MGKLVLLLGGPGSGKSRKLREMFMSHSGSARFIECRHKPESISHVFHNHSQDKQISYTDNTDNLAELIVQGDKAVFLDAPLLTVNELLALSALATSLGTEIYAPLRLTTEGHHPFLNLASTIPGVELSTVE